MPSAENSPRLAQTGDRIDPLDKRKEKCPKAKAGTFGEKTRKPLFIQGFEGSGQTKTILQKWDRDGFLSQDCSHVLGEFTSF